MIRYITAIVAVALVTARDQCQAQQPKVDCASVSATPVDHATMDHTAHLAALEKCRTGPLPTAAGQAAYAAISEIVRILKADSTTDWAKVNVEALRRHLIDMDEVTMRASAAQRNIPGGIEVDVTGSGRTIDAIRRMTINHMGMLDQADDYHAAAKEIPNGARLTITAKKASDPAMVSRIRGLGFAGMMTEGEHHTSHHLALARGEPVHAR